VILTYGYDVKKIASECGIHWKTIEKIIREAEKQIPNWDWQEDFDWYTHCSEIRDYGDREEELRNRIGYRLTTEKEVEQELEEQYEQELDFQMGSGLEGMRELLSRIYKNGDLTNKQKEKLKDKIKEGDTAYNAMLLALFNGEEKSYAKRWLVEKVIGSDRYISDLIKTGTVRIKTRRGWVTEVNGVVLPKALRATEFVQHISEWDKLGSSNVGDATVTIFKKKTISKPVEHIPVPIVITPKPKPVIEKPAIITSIPVDSGGTPDINGYARADSRLAMGGKPLPSMEFCYKCGRIVKTDEFTGTVEGDTVYYCSEYCHATPIPDVVSKYGTGQTVSEDTVTERRRQPVHEQRRF